MGDQNRTTRYRERAAQLRAAAEGAKDQDLRKLFLQLAEEYEFMAVEALRLWGLKSST